MSRIRLIPLFKGFPITTNGTALSKTTLDLHVPGVRSLLPDCEALWLITYMEGVATANIDWNISCFSGFDRNHEVAPFDIGSANINRSTTLRSVDYTTTANFLLEARLQLWWRNSSGVSVANTATIGAVLGARLYGQ